MQSAGPYGKLQHTDQPCVRTRKCAGIPLVPSCDQNNGGLSPGVRWSRTARSVSGWTTGLSSACSTSLDVLLYGPWCPVVSYWTSRRVLAESAATHAGIANSLNRKCMIKSVKSRRLSEINVSYRFRKTQ